MFLNQGSKVNFCSCHTQEGVPSCNNYKGRMWNDEICGTFIRTTFTSPHMFLVLVLNHITLLILNPKLTSLLIPITRKVRLRCDWVYDFSEKFKKLINICRKSEKTIIYREYFFHSQRERNCRSRFCINWEFRVKIPLWKYLSYIVTRKRE